MNSTPVNLFWFRRDLRLHDNAGLYRALKSGNPVLPVFIFDTDILDKLENRKDARVEFIYSAVASLSEQLEKQGSTFFIYHGKPLDAFRKLTSAYTVENVFTNQDYEPYARERDAEITAFLLEKDIAFHAFKDHVIFSKDEVLKDDGKPYTVFTPYSRKWKVLLTDFQLRSYPTVSYAENYFQTGPLPMPTLTDLGFEKSGLQFPVKDFPENIIAKYAATRDFPGVSGTSRLGLHLRFGTISVRELARASIETSPVFLSELIWRDFYQMILWHFPHIGHGLAFKPAYDNIKWRFDEQEFQRWCDGQTGYPIVDAGMRELNATGFMHNRVRMVVASFLTKHLLHDWRLGEAYFATKLLDYDFAANNGGWQWAAGSGCDAAPYFRVFNPALQTKKFDPDLTYIRKWVPELDTLEYPPPIVEHAFARERALRVYKEGLNAR